MSLLTDILDRLSGIAALKERVVELSGQLGEMRKVMVEQQKDIAALQGQLRALIQIQGMVQAQTQAQTQALNQAMSQVTTQALLQQQQSGKPSA
ncbi:MAG: hypothetical protein RLZZ584_2022 [Pseudomonadota bacterium]|jgi:uncharacterized coiled-coil protein SlyX